MAKGKSLRRFKLPQIADGRLRGNEVTGSRESIRRKDSAILMGDLKAAAASCGNVTCSVG